MDDRQRLMIRVAPLERTRREPPTKRNWPDRPASPDPAHPRLASPAVAPLTCQSPTPPPPPPLSAGPVRAGCFGSQLGHRSEVEIRYTLTER